MESESNNTQSTQEPGADAAVITEAEKDLSIAREAEAIAAASSEPQAAAAGKDRTADDQMAKITARRAARRQLDAELARKKAELEALDAQLAERSVEPEKSPLDEFVEQFPDEPVPARITKAEAEFQARRKEAEAEKRSSAEKRRAASDAASQAFERGCEKYSDFETVVEAGAELLTAGQRLDIRDPKLRNPEDKLYRMSIEAILREGGEMAEALRAKLRKQSNSESAPKNETTGGSEEEEEAGNSLRVGGDPRLALAKRLFG